MSMSHTQYARSLGIAPSVIVELIEDDSLDLFMVERKHAATYHLEHPLPSEAEVIAAARALYERRLRSALAATKRLQIEVEAVRNDRGGEPRERFAQQLVPPREVVGHRSQRHISCRRHPPVRGAGHAVLRDHVKTGVDDPVPTLGIVTSMTRRRVHGLESSGAGTTSTSAVCTLVHASAREPPPIGTPP